MKLPCTFIALAALALPAFSFAADSAKSRPNRPQHAAAALDETLKPFDKNGNNQIDADELAAVQKAFSALGKLDKNFNGEIEQSEVAVSAAPAGQARSEGMRTRFAEGFKKLDANGNHRIDPDEIATLEKMMAGGRGEMMKRLDQNGNGKLEESEIARLNERLEKGGAARRPGTRGTPPNNFRRPPEKPAETTKPAETIKPAEKTDKQEEDAKFKDKKIDFGS